MAMDVEQLLRLQVNQPGWSPNTYLLVKRRYFRRPDGHIFAFAETEDWHIHRVLGAGFVEVASPEQPDEVQQKVVYDPRDEQIAAMQEEIARLKKEAEHGTATSDAADNRQSARARR